MVSITTAQLNQLASSARASYKTAFANADTDLAVYGINDNPLRLAHFMAQILHESGALHLQIESMNYSADRIRVVWPTRFASVAAATPYAHNPEKLANKVYGGRMGNTQPGDGWRFIGRGIMQLTGRDSYTRVGNRLGVNLAADPDLVFGPIWSLKIAADEWDSKGCNALADQNNITKITKKINGGLIGLPEREEWFKKTHHIWH